MAKGDDKSEPSGAKQHKPELPHGWTVRVSRSYPDRVYFFNTLTGATTWELPSLVKPGSLQSAEASKKDNSSSLQQKRHRHSHKKCVPTPDRKKHHQQKLQDQQQPCDGGDKDDDLLDLNCEDPLESNSSLFGLTPSDSGFSLQTADSRGSESSSAGGKWRERKKHWKKLWDSPSDPKLHSHTHSQSDQKNQEDCGLSSKELTIIRFPHGSRVGRVEPSTAKAAAKRSELTTPVLTVSSSNQSTSVDTDVADTLINADMGNAFHRFHPGTAAGLDPLARNRLPSTDIAVDARGFLQAASSPSVSRSSSSVPLLDQGTLHSPSSFVSGQSPEKWKPMTVHSPLSSVPGQPAGRVNRTSIPSPSSFLSGQSGSTLNQRTVQNTVQSPSRYVPIQSPGRLRPTVASSPPQSSSAVTVEYRAGLKTGSKQKSAADSSQHTVGSQLHVKAALRAKENPSALEPVVEFRQGFKPISHQRDSESRKGKVSPKTGPAATRVVRPAPFLPRVLSTQSANTTAVLCTDKKAPKVSSSSSRKCTPPAGHVGEANAAQQKTAPVPECSTQTSEQRKRKLKCLSSTGEGSACPPSGQACLEAASNLDASASIKLTGSTEDSSSLVGQQGTPIDQWEERKILKGKRRRRKGRSEGLASSNTTDSGAISPQTSQFHCSAQDPTSPSVMTADRGLTAPSQSATQSPLSLANLREGGITLHPSHRSTSDFSSSSSVESCDGRRKRLCDGLSSSAFTSLQSSMGTASTRSDCPSTSSAPSSSQPQGTMATIKPSNSAFPFSPASVVAVSPAGTSPSSASEGDVAMEVDDEEENGDQIMMDLQELRESFKLEMNTKAMGTLTESVQQAQSTRPITPLHGLVAATKLVYVVVDTNVLIGSLKFVQDLRDMTLKDYGRPYLIIPWIVLQELDAMKGSRFKKMSHEKKAQNAVRYLHSCLVSQHPRVRGQTPAEASVVMEQLPIQCNDDHILKCCLQYHNKHGRRSVLLLTDDLNLENKAVVIGIKCFSTKSLKPQLTEVAVEPSAPEDLASSGFARSSRDSLESTRNVPEQGSQVQQPSKESSTAASGQQQRQQRVKVDELLCGVKMVLKATLPVLVQAEMEEAYGNLWSDVVYRKPPWSAYDLVLVLQKHWIAVFSLKMDRELNILIEHLATKLRPETATQLGVEEVQELVHSSLELLKGVHKCRPCPDAVRQMETVLEEAKGLQPIPEKDRITSPPHSDQSRSSKRRRKCSKPSSSTRCEVDPPERPQSAISPASSSSSCVSSLSLSTNPSRRKSVEMLEDSRVKKQRQATVSSPQAERGKSPVLSGAATGQGGRHMSAEQTKDETSTKRGQSSSQTVSAVLASLNSSNNNNKMMSPPVSIDSSHQIQVPKTITAEEAAVIGEVFQAIWSVIYNCCNNVERMLETSMGSAEVTDITGTLTVLVPLVEQIRNEFGKCLSFSPVGLERHVDNFFLFCSCLNNFFMHSKIPSPPLTPITPGNMIAFMADTKNRVTLLHGLRQLDDMIAQLHSLISRLPDQGVEAR